MGIKAAQIDIDEISIVEVEIEPDDFPFIGGKHVLRELVLKAERQNNDRQRPRDTHEEPPPWLRINANSLDSTDYPTP